MMATKSFVGAALLLVGLTSCELLGENVCKEEKRMRVNMTEYFLRNVTVRDYKWCVNVPPRCSFYTLRTVIMPALVERERLVAVETCCPGFAEKDGSCISECAAKCDHGKCDENGECICMGFNCSPPSSECEQGVYDETAGSCVCFPGWKGNSCESRCDEGYYGEGCLQKCECPFCNSTNGECYADAIKTTDSPRMGEYKRFNHGDPPRLQKYYTFDVTTNTAYSLPATTERESLISVSSEIVMSSTEIQQSTENIFAPQTENVGALQIRQEAVISARSENGNVTHMRRETPAEVLTSDTAVIMSNPNFILGLTVALGSGLVVLVFVATLAVLRRFRKVDLNKRNCVRGAKPPETAASYSAHDIPHQERLTFILPNKTEDHEKCSRCSNKKDNQDFYFYDYPPSTGSYRAASLPEPSSDTEISSLKTASTLIVEHVYDEIPAHRCVDIIAQSNFSVHFNKMADDVVYCNESSNVSSRADNCKF